MTKTRVYLSGPMSNMPDNNYPAFYTAADNLRKLGYAVINPAELAGPSEMDWFGYMRQDIRWITDCDAIALLPDWEQSTGAPIELFVALSLGLKVIDALTGAHLPIKLVRSKLQWTLLHTDKLSSH